LFATTSEGFESNVNERWQIISNIFFHIITAISDSKGKITFEVFEKWLDKTNALNGFDLTKTLL